MLSNILDRISLISISLIVILLPIFFLPFTRIPVEASKGLILVVGLAVALIAWAAARFTDGKITIPKSHLLLSALGVVGVFLISAIFSSAPKVSFFGIMLDTGTFWYILACFLVLLLSAILIKDASRARIILLGTLAALSVTFLFQIARFFHPDTLSMGVLGGKTDNLIGSWNTFGIMTGLWSIMALFIIEFFNISKAFKWILGIMMFFAVMLSASVNFALVWELLGIFALLIFVYKISISSPKKEGETGAKFPVFSFVMVMVSLLFFMSGQFIGGFLPNELGLTNVEVRPSLSSTFSVAKDAIAHNPVLGIGPNRWNELWASYKPTVINSTQFWNSGFASGSGTIPTLMANTGILGIISLIVFFVVFILGGVRALFAGMKKGLNSDAILFFLGALYLFIASWFYSVGFVVLIIAFAFTGIFMGLTLKNKEEHTFLFLSDPRRSFFFILGLIALMVLTAGITFKYVERFASVPYYGKVFRAQTITEAEGSIARALTLYQNDLYLRTANEVYLTKINSLAQKGAELTEAERVELQTAFNLAESSALMARSFNSKNYINHQTLGATYNVAGSLGVSGAYDRAIESFQAASALNPSNPGLRLIIARTYMTAGKISEAKPFAQEALNLKPDYIDALIVLSQIERSLGNTAAAISYAEGALSLLPGNQELINYVNSIKGGNTNVSAPVLEEDTSTETSGEEITE